MGNSDLFLGSSFKWNWLPDKNLSVHVYQQAFTKHAASRFGLKYYKLVPLMTPYCSGWPTDFIPDPNPDLPKRKAVYQSIYVLIN